VIETQPPSSLASTPETRSDDGIAACPPSLTGSWPGRPATPTSQRLGPLQGTPNARPITLIRIGPRGAAGERSLLLRPTRCPCAWFTSRHFQVCFCSISRHSSVRLQCPKPSTHSDSCTTAKNVAIRSHHRRAPASSVGAFTPAAARLNAAVSRAGFGRDDRVGCTIERADVPSTSLV